MAPPGIARRQLRKGKRPTAQPQTQEVQSGIRRRTLTRAAARRPAEERAELEPEVRAHFQPAAGDSVTVYGDIAYAKSWCGFKHPRGSSAAYATWREQIKAYIIARPLDPGRLTESQVDSIISFARGLSPVKERIELIKRQHHADDVWELIRHLKILVKDSAKKLQTSNERQRAERDDHGDIAEPPIAHSDWGSPYSPRAVRIHIVRRTGAPAAQHPFLGHPWCVRDSDRGIAWGVLATPSIRDLLRVVRGQDVEEEINCPRYLIGATGEGATRLRQDPEDPLPLRQLIFLNRDDDIRAWLLANNGHDPLDLLVIESRPEDGDDLDETPEPPNGRYPFFDRDVWDEWAGAEDVAREMQEEEEWIDEDEWLQGEPGGTTRAPRGAGVIVVDDGDDHSPGVPGPSRRRRNIPLQMEEPASSNRFAPGSGVPASGTSGPSESEMLQKLRKFAQENPWATNLLANPGLVAVRPQGNDGAEDTPPAGPMTRDELPFSPPSPAAPAANLDFSTPERTVEHPAHTTQLPPSNNVAPTQPRASVTPPARGSSIQSSEHSPENTPSETELRRSGRRRPGGK